MLTPSGRQPRLLTSSGASASPRARRRDYLARGMTAARAMPSSAELAVGQADFAAVRLDASSVRGVRRAMLKPHVIASGDDRLVARATGGNCA